MDERTLYYILGGVVLAILLTCYIIALVKSKRGEMVFTTNGWDMALLLGCPILYMAGWCFGMEPPYNTFQIIVWILSAACLIGTIIFSIVSNKDSLWKILCSVFAKLFTVILTVFLIFLFIAALIVSIMLTLVAGKGNDDHGDILLRYDHFLKAYVGYRV